MEEEGGEGGNMGRIGKDEEKMGGWEMEISLKEQGKNDKAGKEKGVMGRYGYLLAYKSKQACPNPNYHYNFVTNYYRHSNMATISQYYYIGSKLQIFRLLVIISARPDFRS